MSGFAGAAATGARVATAVAGGRRQERQVSARVPRREPVAARRSAQARQRPPAAAMSAWVPALRPGTRATVFDRWFRLGARLGFGFGLRRFGRLFLDAHQHVLVKAVFQHDIRCTTGADLRGDLRVPLLRRGHHDALAGRRSLAADRRKPRIARAGFEILSRNIHVLLCERREPAASAAASSSFLPFISYAPLSNPLLAKVSRNMASRCGLRIDVQLDSRRAIVVARAPKACARGHAAAHACEERCTVLRSD